ncbi:MAG: GNAT family N-acetyltransferase [Kutzneria sp.]|nr:GNAT family N-acetyltransferase [Kutzneria sp.]
MSESGSPSGDVRIRAVRDRDLEVFFSQQLDPEATRRAAFPARARDVFMAHWATSIVTDPTVTVRSVLADGQLAGYVICWEQSGRYWVGYWYGREFWGRGVATRALALFLDEVRVRPLHADPIATNVGSIRVLEKCGFVRCANLTIDTVDTEHILLVLSRTSDDT